MVNNIRVFLQMFSTSELMKRGILLEKDRHVLRKEGIEPLIKMMSENRVQELVDSSGWSLDIEGNFKNPFAKKHKNGNIKNLSKEELTDVFLNTNSKINPHYKKTTSKEFLNETEQIEKEDTLGMTQKLLKKKKQIILYGPPGTGKTYNTKNIAIRLLGDEKTYEKYQEEGRIEFITFHPSYSYEEFIEGITVATEGEDIPTESLQYVCKSGIFKNMCKRALGSAIGLVQDEINKKTWQEVYGGYIKKENIDFEKAAKHVLIIDEINRGDIAKILGELITLLEADKRLGEDNELIAKLPASGDRFCVPPNLYIIATMNTADRSLALLDVALRRRFGFIEMNPDLGLIEEYINENSEDIEEDARRLLTKSIDAVRKINIEISKDKAIGRDKQIGHSFLFKVHTIDDLILAWRHEILPLLEEYCYSDYLKINQIVFGRDTDWISQTDGIKEINRMNIGQMLDEIIKE